MGQRDGLYWRDAKDFATARPYQCGYCGKVVAANKGFIYCDGNYHPHNMVCICPHCLKATYFHANEQTPGVPYGEPVENLPEMVLQLYMEMRNCMQASAYTASALLARKLLMNVAVSQGAAANEAFAFYVDWLGKNGYVPPKAKVWIDHLRKMGNEATHEVHATTEADARDLVSFTSMILRMVFDYPARVPANLATQS